MQNHDQVVGLSSSQPDTVMLRTRKCLIYHPFLVVLTRSLQLYHSPARYYLLRTRCSTPTILHLSLLILHFSSQILSGEKRTHDTHKKTSPVLQSLSLIHI